MMTSGVYIMLMLFVACLASVFPTLTRLRGHRFAFLATCWLPPAGLLATFVLRDQLSYAVLAALAAVIVASFVLAGVGVSLCVQARRDEGRLASLMAGTLVAGSPMLILLALWLTQS